MTDPKTALVTGGSKRVGRAIVERLAAAGYRVLITYNRDRTAAEEMARDLNHRREHSAYVFEVDLTDADAADRVANIVRLSVSNKLNLLVNNASMFVPDDGPVGASVALQRQLFDVNATAPATLMAALASALSAARGCVVNMLDILTERPWPQYSAYCASKAALHASTLAFARKLAPAVRVNGISPGVIQWPDDMPAAERAAYLKRVPLARSGTPADAAELVLHLAEAMPYVTGQVIRLDGGRSLM